VPEKSDRGKQRHLNQDGQHDDGQKLLSGHERDIQISVESAHEIIDGQVSETTLRNA
jgi:hypothetical protein